MRDMTDTSMTRKSWLRWWWVLPALLALLIGAFLVWAWTPLGPMPEALAAMESSQQVTVDGSRWLAFQPTDAAPQAGLIFYPGGRVDHRAYAPLARAIAADGYLVVIVPMPLNLAVTGLNRADDVIAAYPDVARWAIGGHSLGGAMASRYVYNHPGAMDGLLLWASYPAASDDLSARPLAVTSIYGTLDGVATGAEIDASRPLLPSHTVWAPIDGGNHAQFGWYGEQGGDNPATISRQAQAEQIVAYSLALLDGLEQK